MGRGELNDFHPVIDEWGGVWMVPGQVRAVPKPKHG
jgi:hypothetical protein